MTDTDTGGSSADRPMITDARQRRTTRRLAVMLTSASGAAVVVLIAVLLGAPVVPAALLPGPHDPDPGPATGRAAAPRQATSDDPYPAAPEPARLATTIVVATMTPDAPAHTTPPAPPTTTTEPGRPHHRRWPTFTFTFPRPGR
ncbi:MAG TPA: hypothetical protein VHF06_31295 [Pseudonocardiaceae bacterium]|nr:hypothetical protein [Pseudonocardiaceae bacterium]